MRAMPNGIVLTVLRAGIASLVLVAIAVQMRATMAADAFNATRFFAFFTIQSNLLAAGVLLATVVTRARSPLLDWLRGAAVVYLTVTFVVFIVLLAHIDVQLVIPWVDFSLHKITPVFIVIDWLIAPPSARIRVGRAVLWLAFPLVWLIVTLVRGAIDGWYPYPFLDPANGDYAAVAFTCAAILIGFLIVSLLTMLIANAWYKRAEKR